MFFKLKSDVMFRNYKSFGYITDNRNFGYKESINQNDIGDKIVSQSGAIFLSVLSREPQTFDDLTKKLNKQFTDVNIEIIKKDAKEFYIILSKEGFIISGETFQECNENDIKFSYKKLESKIKNNVSSLTIVNNEKSTQDFFNEYFKGKPQLTNIHIEITSKCNERCVHCYIPHDYKVSEIDPNLFYDILKQCKDMKLLHLTLSGGEPMMHKSFCDFLKKCKEFNFSLNILSNLTLLNDEILNEMKTNDLLGVQVSLYSMKASIHDEITQIKGSFEKTKNAILN